MNFALLFSSRIHGREVQGGSCRMCRLGAHSRSAIQSPRSSWRKLTILCCTVLHFRLVLQKNVNGLTLQRITNYELLCQRSHVVLPDLVRCSFHFPMSGL